MQVKLSGMSVMQNSPRSLFRFLKSFNSRLATRPRRMAAAIWEGFEAGRATALTKSARHARASSRRGRVWVLCTTRVSSGVRVAAAAEPPAR